MGASFAIMVEKIISRYLLIEMDQDQAPKQIEEERVAEVLAMATKCCEDSDVPEFCLGLCSPTDAMSRSILGDSLNACAKYKASIEKCFEPVVQEILKKDGKEGQAVLAQLGARFGPVLKQNVPKARFCKPYQAICFSPTECCPLLCVKRGPSDPQGYCDNIF